MKKDVIKYGLIGGAIVSLFMVFTIPFMDADTDMGNSELLGYATMIVALSTIFIGVRSYRNNQLEGYISFGKAFLTGLYIAVIASTLYVITWMILSHFFLPDFMDTYINNMVEQMKESGSSQAEIEAYLGEMNEWGELYKNPFFKILITYMEILPVGLLISLLTALTLKKNKS